MWVGLEEFFQVIEQGSFTAAAKVMNVSTSHVSRHVGQLEKRLGVILIQRSTRKISLTDAGHQYFANLETSRHELTLANDQIQGNQKIPKGPITISTAGNYAAQIIAPVIAKFTKQYPAVSIHMDFTYRNVNLIEEGIDIAIRFGPMKDSKLIARKLVERTMVLAASQAYVDQRGEPISPYELSRHNCLTSFTNKWRFQFEEKIKEIKVDGNWSSNNDDAVLSACREGLGIAYVAKDMIENDIKEGRLQYILYDYRTDNNPTWLVYPRKDLMPLRVRMFIDYLLESFLSQEKLTHLTTLS